MTQALDRLAARAEIVKLARVLGASEERFEFLQDVPAADIRTLRDQATETLHTAHQPVLRKLVSASGIIPVPVLVTLAQKAFGPLLSARLAGLLDGDRGVAVALKLPAPFLADVAADLDPRRAGHILSALPTATVTDVSRELRRREDWITLGRFVGGVPAEIAEAGLAELNERQVLEVAFVVDDKSSLSALVERQSTARCAAYARAADEYDLWHALFDLFAHLDDTLRTRVVTAGLAEDPELRARAHERAAELGVESLLS
ncbi:hypothetical protein GCM10009676_09240 [Prauserella halophila]|uniref:DUF2336 domain-containing protein n=1 Tax=Prauserella halophila TaxID=185641 RepID=A0ABP4GLG6_9PSEU|nr:hypothetical protein [Prauserella halophila]MCP2235280.1 hypothetical protein [Prauserella halophila]